MSAVKQLSVFLSKNFCAVDDSLSGGSTRTNDLLGLLDDMSTTSGSSSSSCMTLKRVWQLNRGASTVKMNDVLVFSPAQVDYCK